MDKQPVEFDVNGLTLRGNLYLPESPKKLAVLFLHGWTGVPNEEAAKVLAENGFTSMTFSLSGHNDSEGAMEDQTRAKSLIEVLAAYDFIRSQIPASSGIVAAGTSYGSYMAILLSAIRSVVALQLRVPPNYPDDKFSDKQINQGGDNAYIMEWRTKALGSKGTRALAAINNFGGPIQIIEAEKDDRVPHQTIKNYLDAIKDRTKLDYHFMKGWPHSLGLDEERNKQYQNLLLNWLNEQL